MCGRRVAGLALLIIPCWYYSTDHQNSDLVISDQANQVKHQSTETINSADHYRMISPRRRLFRRFVRSDSDRTSWRWWHLHLLVFVQTDDFEQLLHLSLFLASQPHTIPASPLYIDIYER
jgi:hypothetical protein